MGGEICPNIEFNPPHPLPNHLHLKVQNSSSFSKHEFLDLSLISKDWQKMKRKERKKNDYTRPHIYRHRNDKTHC